MNRYLLFAGDAFYPMGGWQDFHGSFDSVSEALAFAEAHAHPEDDEAFALPFDWIEVVDSSTNQLASMPKNGRLSTFDQKYTVADELSTSGPLLQ